MSYIYNILEMYFLLKFFYLSTWSHVWTQFFPLHFPNFISFLFCLSFISSSFSFRVLFYLITKFQLEIYGILSHEAKLRTNIFIHLQTH